MKNIHKLISSILLLIAFTLTSAKAEDRSFAIGVYGIQSTFDSKGHEEDDNYTKGSGGVDWDETTKSKDQDYASVFIEMYSPRSLGFSITTGLEYTPGEASLGAATRTDTDIDATLAAAGVSKIYSAKAEVKDMFSIYLEPTWGNDTFGIYGKVGAKHLTIATLEDLDSGINSSTYDNKDIWGGSYGAGVKYTHGSGIMVKLETLKTEYPTLNFNSSTGNKNRVTADIEEEATRLAIGYAF